MKKYYMLNFIVILYSISGLACGSLIPPVDNNGGARISIKADTEKPERLIPTTGRDESLNNTVENEPALFNYIINSDYVVRARVYKIEPVALVHKTEKDPNIVNIADGAAGSLRSFKVEKVLCSKDFLVQRRASAIGLFQEFRVFLQMGDEFNEFYNRDGRSYLIFLEKVLDEEKEKLSSVYELDRTQSYFRAYQNKKSIFPESRGSFHPPPKKGIIEMSDTRHQELIMRIETLCQALNADGINSKIGNLMKLTESPDKELRDNAVYAISWLRKLRSE